MINYSQFDIEYSKTLKCRNTLLRLSFHCSSGEKIAPAGKKFEYLLHFYDIRMDIEYLLKFYDNGGKLNENFLIELYDVKKFSHNPIILKRLIKLIKIV